MLCQFSFHNFRSYRDETIFDFQAAPFEEFKDSLIRGDKTQEDLLPVGVIYGPNGGGKSNLLRALGCVISLITDPVYDLKKTRADVIIQQKSECTPYLFDDQSSTESTTFQLFFRVGSCEYQYQIEILHDNILFEMLYRRVLGASSAEKVFERDSDKITFGLFDGQGINTAVNEKMPFLSFLAINYSIPVITEVITWFEECIVQDYANPMMEKGLLLSKEPTFKKKLITMMNDMGIDISGYRIDSQRDEFLLQRTLQGKMYELPFLNESDGTQKLFVALPVIWIALQEGRLIVIDELDAKLHPMLIRYIIRLFTNPKINKKGAQLLFSSHNIFAMKNNLLRRDEIWFAELNENNCSELYSLSELRDENDIPIDYTAAYDKQYLDGRYGATPYLRNILLEEL